MHELAARALDFAGKILRAERVDRERKRFVLLASVHVRHGCAVDREVIRTVLLVPAVHGVRVGNVKHVAVDIIGCCSLVGGINGADLGRAALKEPSEFIAKLPSPARHKNLHRFIHLSVSMYFPSRTSFRYWPYWFFLSTS